MAPVLVKYRKLLTLALANNAILFTTTSVVGHRVQIKMSVDDLNTFFIWQRPSGSIRPVGHFLSEVNGVKFSEIILDSLNKNYIDLDGNTDGLNFSSYVFDANIDSRIRTSNKVSSNDLVMAYILYKCYGSSTCPTANVIYNLEDAQAILSSTSVSMSITSSFEEDEALSNLGGSDLGGVDAMFRNMLASAPLRFFQANGTQIPGLFETHFATSPSDPAGQGSWQFMENDTLELRICFTFQQPVSNESINESGIASSTTVIKAGDTFSIRLQILATDTSSGAAAKAVVAAAAAAAANTAATAAASRAAAAALVAAAEAQQQVNAASAQENYESEQLANILSAEARQQINVTNSASILNIAQAALNSAILEGSSYQVIQHARTASLTAAATLAQNEATLLHLSTQMLQLTINHNVTVSTLNGKQAAAAQALLISATTNSLTAQAAYAAASSQASASSASQASASVSQSTLQLQMLLSNATDPTLLLNNKLAFITASNASMTTWSNALLAHLNEQDALSQLTNAQQIMNAAIILGNTSGIQIMMANVNAYSIIETTAKAALLSTNIALVNTAATEYTAYTTLISNSNLAANLSNLLATESYNSASLNLSTTISNLSTTVQSDSYIQALVSLSQLNLTSSVNGGGMVNDTLTSTLLGYTTIAMSSSAAVTRTNAASNAAQTILFSASSNVTITSSNLSTIVSNNAALFSTFSTSMVTMMNYENSVLANPSTINAAQAVNSAHITYNTMLENQELASNALLVAQRILDTTIANQGSPQQIALLQANVTTAQGRLTSANGALSMAASLYNSASLNATEDPNALAILNLAASNMALSISTALNDQLANNLYAAISTQTSLTTVLNNTSLAYTLATSALNNAITTGRSISEIQSFNSNLNVAKVAYTNATIAASTSALAVSTAQTNVTADPSTMSILESAALIRYNTRQASLSETLVQQVTALYEESSASIQTSLVAQVNYSTSISALMNAVVSGAGISTIQGLQAAVNSTGIVYANMSQSSIAIGTALINQEQMAIVNPLAQNLINLMRINNGSSAISQSVNTSAAALVTAQTQSASTLVAMQIAQTAYDTAISALDSEISSGQSISQIQAAQTTLQNAGASLATTTMNYNYIQSTLTQTSYSFSTLNAAYMSSLSQTNIVPLSQALLNVNSQVAQIVISVSTQTAAIASQEIVNLASIVYDSQASFLSSMTNLSTISSVTSLAQNDLSTLIASSASSTEVSSALSTFQSDSTQLDLVVARTAAAQAVYSTSQNTVLHSNLLSYVYAAIANYSDPTTSVQPPPYPPTSITFTSVVASAFTVNWTGGIAATSYTYSINGIPAVPTQSTNVSATFTNLDEHTLYTVIVTAVNSKGSTSSSPFTVTTRGVPPVQPIPSISNLTTTSVQIDWSGGDGVTSYSYSMNGSRVTPSIDNSLLSKSVVFTGLVSNSTYAIVVTAENTYGSTSSPPITLTTLLAPPTQVTALTSSSITPSGFTIGWTGGVRSSSYSYTLNGSPVTPSTDNGMTAQTATFTLLQPSTSYTLIITSTNSAGSISSSPCVILTSPATIPPSAPNLTRSFTYSTLHVSWIGGIGATSFSFVLNGVATVPSSSTGSSADFTGLTPSTSYTLVVSAVNAIGSTSSSPMTITTAIAPPTAITFTNSQNSINITDFTLTWSGGVGATLYAFVLNDVSTVPSSSTSSSATFNGLLPATSYTVAITATNSSGSSSESSTVTTALPIFKDQWLSGVSYNQYDITIGQDSTAYSCLSPTSTANPVSSPSFWSPISTPYAGSWISSQSYSPNYSVNSPINNQLYKCIQATTTGQQDPSLDTSSWTLIARAGNEPSQVVDVVSSAITPTGFTVSWSGGLGATSYSYVLNGANVVPSTDNGVSSKSAVFTGLVTRTQYTLYVMAKNQDGGSSSLPTVITTITNFPTEPTNLVSSSISATGFTIAWTGNARTTSYTYTLNDIPVTPFRDNSVFFRNVIFTELIPSKAYTVIVTAINANGSSPSQPFTVTTSNPTQAPSIPVVSATDITSYLITLSWTGGQYATSYAYEMNGYYITPDINNGLTGKTVTFLNLNAKTSYTLLVTAINSIGNTDAIPFVVSTNDIPPPPAVVAITSVITSSITTTGFTVNWSGGDNSTSYTYLLNGRATTPSTDNGLSSKSAVFTDLTPGTMYILSITGSNILYSESCFPLPIVTTLSVPPTQPTNADATDVTDTGFTVIWSGGDGATSYTYALNDVSVTPSTDNGVSSKSAVFTGLLPSTSYKVVVTSTNSAGSTSSTPFNVSTLVAPPTQPTNADATSVTDTGFTVIWSGGDVATSYSYVLNDVDTLPSTDNGVSSKSAVFTGLLPLTSYTVVVTAVNDNGSSGSTPFNVSTLPPPPPTSIVLDNFNAVIDITGSGFTLVWTGGDGATSYSYDVTDPSGGVYVPSTDNGVSGKTAIFTGLPSTTAFTIVLTAINMTGSTTSVQYTTLTSGTLTPNTVVVGLVHSGYSLTWSGGDGAVSYSYSVTDVCGNAVNPMLTDNGISSKSALFQDFNPLYSTITIITATDSSGNTASSEPIYATTGPSAVDNFSVSSVTGTEFTIHWMGGNEATSYTYLLNGVPTVPSIDNGLTSQSATFSGLTPGHTYSVIVSIVHGTLSTPSTYTPGTPINLSSNFVALPYGLAIDQSNNLYISTYGPPCTLISVTPTGTTVTLAGTTNQALSSYGLCYNAARSLLIQPDFGNHRVFLYDLSGNAIGLIGGGGNGSTPGNQDGPGQSSTYMSPSAAVADLAGNTYILDAGNNNIRILDTSNTTTTFVSGFNAPMGITIDSLGNLYVADTGYHCIKKITTDGTVSVYAGVIGTPGSTNSSVPTHAYFNSPSGLTCDASDNIIVADTGNNIIRVILTSGEVITYAGTGATGFFTGYLLSSTFNGPWDVKLDSTGANLYVTDSQNNGLRVLPYNLMRTDSCTVTTSEPPPTTPSVINSTLTDTTITLEWVGGDGADSYSYVLNGVSTTPSADNGVSSKSATFSGLTVSTSYTIGITAINAGGSSTPSSISLMTSPVAPSNLSYTATDTSISLSWDAGTGASSYSYTLNGSEVTPSTDNGISSNSVVFSGLVTVTSYTIVVTAINSGGSSSSLITIVTQSSHPTNVRYVVEGSVHIDLYGKAVGCTVHIHWDGGYGAISYKYRMNGTYVIPDIDNGISSNSVTLNNLMALPNTFDVIATNAIKKPVMLCVGGPLGQNMSELSYTYDGIDWIVSDKLYTDPTISQFRSIATDNSLILLTTQTTASASNYNIYSSTDGLNWSLSHTGPSYVGVVYGNSLWIAWGYTTIVYSYDGLSWANVPWDPTIFPSSITKIIWTGTNWIVIGTGENYVAYSSDGITWSKSISGNAAFSETSITAIHNNGDLVIAGGSSYIYSRDSGITWTVDTPPLPSIYSIKWNGTVWIIAGQGADSPSNIKYSTDGMTWTNAPGASYVSYYCSQIAVGPSLNIAFGMKDSDNYATMHSTDGINWTPSLLSSIVIFDSVFITTNELSKSSVVFSP